jgi:hypothetical protein
MPVGSGGLVRRPEIKKKKTDKKQDKKGSLGRRQEFHRSHYPIRKSSDDERKAEDVGGLHNGKKDVGRIETTGNPSRFQAKGFGPPSMVVLLVYGGAGMIGSEGPSPLLLPWGAASADYPAAIRTDQPLVARVLPNLAGG